MGREMGLEAHQPLRVRRLVIFVLASNAGGWFWFWADRVIGPDSMYGWIGLGISAISAAAALLLAILEFGWANWFKRHFGGRKLLPSLLVLVGLVCLVWGLTWYAIDSLDEALGKGAAEGANASPHAGSGEPSSSLTQSNQGPPPLTHWLKSDFPNTLKVAKTYKFQMPDGEALDFRFQIYCDFSANAYFAGAYLPNSALTFEAAKMIGNDPEKLAADLKEGVGIEAKSIGQEPKDCARLLFSRQVYIYHEAHLSDRQKADLRDAFGSNQLEIDFRGPDWQMLQWMRNRDKGKT